MHRPRMDWAAASRRTERGTLEGRLFAGFRRLAEARASTPQLQEMGATVRPLHHDNPHVLAWVRSHPRFGALLGLANVDDSEQSVTTALCGRAGLRDPEDVLGLWPADAQDGRIRLPPLSVLWVTDG
jgi:amylosucrase